MLLGALCAAILLARGSHGACEGISEREIERRALSAAEKEVPALIERHCKIGADEPPFLAEQRMQHCRDRLLALTLDEHRKALIAQCEEDEAASESDARRDEGESSASRIEL